MLKKHKKLLVSAFMEAKNKGLEEEAQALLWWRTEVSCGKPLADWMVRYAEAVMQ